MNYLNIFILSLIINSNAIAQTINFPQIANLYHREAKPHCTCQCENRIIYQNEKASYENILKFAEEGVIASYQYGFGNYETALKNASQYYTPQGWLQFSEALEASGNLKTLVENALILSALPRGEVKLLKHYQEDNKSVWFLEVPIFIKIQNSQKTEREALNVHIKVIQLKEKAGIQGLGIQQIVASVKKTV